MTRARFSPFLALLMVLALTAMLSPALVHGQAVKQAPSKVSFGQVVERCGIAGSYTIGRVFAPRGETSRGNDEWLAPDGTVITTNSRRIIAEIRISNPGVFTQRYVVNRETTLNDVLQRYGSAQPRRQRSSRPDGRDFVLEYAYEGISFVFGGVPATVSVGRSVGSQFNRPVSAIIVHEKERDPSGRDYSCPMTSKK